MVVCTSGNAVIVKDEGRSIQYKRMCPSCGYVDSQLHSACVSHSVDQAFGAFCNKCHKPLGHFKFERH